jgi:hypothetical protein
MKLIILCLNTVNKTSPMSKGVMEIRINSQPCKGINLTTRHTQAQGHHEWQQFITWSTSRVGSYLTLVPFSTCMPRRTHCGWPEHYPIIHPWSEIRYHLTHWHTMLLSLGFHMSRMRQYIQVLVQQGSTDTGLNRHRRGLPPWSSEFMIQITLSILIQYSLFSSNCLTRSPIMPIIQSSC